MVHPCIYVDRIDGASVYIYVDKSDRTFMYIYVDKSDGTFAYICEKTSQNNKHIQPPPKKKLPI